MTLPVYQPIRGVDSVTIPTQDTIVIGPVLAHCWECDAPDKCDSAETCYAMHEGFPRKTAESR